MRKCTPGIPSVVAMAHLGGLSFVPIIAKVFGHCVHSRCEVRQGVGNHDQVVDIGTDQAPLISPRWAQAEPLGP